MSHLKSVHLKYVHLKNVLSKICLSKKHHDPVGSNLAANYAATTKLNQTFCILTSNWCLFKKPTSLFVLQNIFFIKLNKSFELFIH